MIIFCFANECQSRAFNAHSCGFPLAQLPLQGFLRSMASVSFLCAPARCSLSGPVWCTSHSLKCVTVICVPVLSPSPSPQGRGKNVGFGAPKPTSNLGPTSSLGVHPLPPYTLLSERGGRWNQSHKRGDMRKPSAGSSVRQQTFSPRLLNEQMNGLLPTRLESLSGMITDH